MIFTRDIPKNFPKVLGSLKEADEPPTGPQLLEPQGPCGVLVSGPRPVALPGFPERRAVSVFLVVRRNSISIKIFLSSVYAPNLCFRALGCPGCLLVVLRRMSKLDLDQKLDDLSSV